MGGDLHMVIKWGSRSGMMHGTWASDIGASVSAFNIPRAVRRPLIRSVSCLVVQTTTGRFLRDFDRVNNFLMSQEHELRFDWEKAHILLVPFLSSGVLYSFRKLNLHRHP